MKSVSGSPQARALPRETLYGHDAPPLRLHREHEAGAHRLALEQHRARATDAMLAAHVRARQVQVLAEKVGQGGARLRGARPRLPVDDEANRLLHGRLPHRSSATISVRSASTPATRRR